MRAPPSVRIGKLSSRWRPRTVVVTAISIAATLLVAIVSLGVGDFTMTPDRVVATLAGYGDRKEDLVIMTVRLPRILTGLAAGAALALAGALLLTTAGNPLASPDLLGVTAGASAGAVAVITLGGKSITAQGIVREIGVPGAAVLGAVLATGMVVALTSRSGMSGLHPLLVGIGVSAFFGGIVSWLLIAAPIGDAARANVWLTGSLNSRSWPELWPIAITVAVVGVLLVPLAHFLDSLRLGPDIARALGVPVGRISLVFAIMAVALTAVSAAAVGPLGFVALVGPHVARLAVGATRAPLLTSAVLGALLVAVSDLVARIIFAPVQLPAGAVIAVVGAPFLLWLLISERRRNGL